MSKSQPSRLPPGYEIRELSREEFLPLWKTHGKAVFNDCLMVQSYEEFLDAEANSKFDEIRKNTGNIFVLRLGLFFEGNFVGWSMGNQETMENGFYMRNSAVLPEHRRRGLYTALMNEVLRRATEAGFQKILSRHNNTNNEVIVPKLKAGFHITSLEVSDIYGILVHLVYFPHAIRKKVLDFRSGRIKPDVELKKLFRLD